MMYHYNPDSGQRHFFRAYISLKTVNVKFIFLEETLRFFFCFVLLSSERHLIIFFDFFAHKKKSERERKR